MTNNADLNKIAQSILDKSGVTAKVQSRQEEKPDPNYDPVLWIRDNFYIPEVRGPMPLMFYHRMVLTEAYRRDESGRFVYSTVVWSDIKKSAKSSIAAAVALERAFSTPFASIKIVANDLKQADSRVAFYLRRALDLNPRLKSQARQKMYKTTLANRSMIEAVPIDPKGEAGGNDDLIVFSELWGGNTEAMGRMWTELTLSPTKFGYSQRWIETYAGFSGESELLENLYEQGVKEGELIDLGIDGLEVYRNVAARQLTLWNTQPRCPWQSQAYYAQEAAVLTDSEFNRVHRNIWASAQNPFIPIEWWDAAKVAKVPELDKYREVIVALDAAVSDDCFAIVVVSREADKLVVRSTRIYAPEKGQKILYSSPNTDDPNAKYDREYPEGEIRYLADQFNVIAFVYDSYQLHHLCTYLRNDGVGYFEEFPQGAPRLESDKQLYDLIKQRRIVHDGDPLLRSHVQNANREETGDSKMRIIKRSQKLKIDACVALSMASYRALDLLTE